jgi:molecular chaperone DnaK
MPQIEVSFDIDANGILNVSAKDLQSGKEQKIRIEAKSGLSEDEIKSMLKDAEDHAEEDKKKKEVVEVRNEADAMVFRAQKALDDNKGKIAENIASEVQSSVDATKKALEGTDISAIKAAKDQLNQKMQKIGGAMQSQGAEAQPGPAPQGESAKSESADIEEAEVEILDEDSR